MDMLAATMQIWNAFDIVYYMFSMIIFDFVDDTAVTNMLTIWPLSIR